MFKTNVAMQNVAVTVSFAATIYLLNAQGVLSAYIVKHHI